MRASISRRFRIPISFSSMSLLIDSTPFCSTLAVVFRGARRFIETLAHRTRRKFSILTNPPTRSRNETLPAPATSRRFTRKMLTGTLIDEGNQCA